MIVAADPAAVDAAVAAEFAGMADAGDFALGSGYMTVVRAQASRLRGRLGEASRYARQGRARLASSRIFEGLACAELAHAAALAGDTATAVAAMAEADALHPPTMRILYPHLEQARVWVAASTGGVPAAVAFLEALLVMLRDDGFAGYEVFALHDLVRLGHPADAVDRLAAVAPTVEGVLAPVAARHARAAVRGDGAALLDVAEEFAALGLDLYAAEAATAAVHTLRAARSTLLSRATERRGELAGRCEGARTPALHLPRAALTDRERQIARLAATGVASKQIADQLFLSPRTVDNHLLRVYAKLGVTGRAELGAALRGLAD